MECNALYTAASSYDRRLIAIDDEDLNKKINNKQGRAFTAAIIIAIAVRL